MVSNIGKKMLLWVLALVVIPLALVSIYIYHQGRLIVREKIYSNFHLSAESFQAKIRYLLETKKTRALDFSSDGFILKSLDALNSGKGQGSVISELSRHLRNKAALDADILDIVVMDMAGRPVSSSEKALLKGGLNYSEFFNAWKNRVAVGTIEGTRPDRYFSVSAPLVKHSTGDFLGVFVVIFRASAIDGILTGSLTDEHPEPLDLEGSLKSIKMYVVDKNEVVIAGPQDILGRRADTEIVRSAVIEGKETAKEYAGIFGDRRVGASVYMEEPRWGIIVSASKTEVFAPLYGMMMRAFSLIAAGIVVVFALTIMIANRIARPLLKIADAADNIALGNFDQPVEVDDKNGEVARLGIAFNAMVRKLKWSFSDLQQKKERILTLNRFYTVISRINEAIVRARETRTIYHEACRIAVEDGLFRMAWIGFVDHSSSLVKRVAQCGIEEGYLEKIRISVEDVPEGRGPAGTAIREGRYVVCNDIENDPRMRPWHEEARKRGYRSSASFPLRLGGSVAGAFSLYAGEAGFFDGENIALLEQMASDISFAIEFIEKENQRKKQEEQVQLLQSITCLISEANDISSSLRVVLEKICDRTKWVYGEAWVPAPDGKALVCAEVWSCGKAREDFSRYSKGLSFAAGEGLPGRVWAVRQPEWIKDVIVNGSVYPRAAKAIEAGLRAGLGVPIISDGTVSAVLVFYMQEPGGEDEQQVKLISSVASQLGSVIGRKKAEAALHESESKYRTLIRNIPQRIFLKDRDSVYISCNDKYASDLKILPDEIKGKSDYAFHPKELAEKYRSDEKRIMERGEAEELEEIYVNEGKQSFVNTIKVPTRNERGDVTGILGIFRDVTERKKAEAERQKLEEQLRHIQKIEAVGRLTGGIAHDFNNMLTVMVVAGTILQKKTEGNASLAPLVQQILAATERASALTRGLLAFSRKQIMEVKAVNLNVTIRNIEKLLRSLIGEDIELSVRLPDEDVTVMADNGQIEQVLMNLAANSRDAMPNGGRLTISTETVHLSSEFTQACGCEQGGAYALIMVEDTGVGMDKEVMDNIFEPFFTTKQVGKGTGLGLSIVYGIVKQHNGIINVYSEKGLGTAFRIYLPLAEPDSIPVTPESFLNSPAGDETVLLAEDNAQVRKITKSVLEEAGYRVIEAEDGEDALNKFREKTGKIDLVMLDVVMPKKSGKEAYDEIKKMAPGVRVLFTSGYTDDIILKRGILDGGINFISKPIIPTNLLIKIREALDK